MVREDNSRKSDCGILPYLQKRGLTSTSVTTQWEISPFGVQIRKPISTRIIQDFANLNVQHGICYILIQFAIN